MLPLSSSPVLTLARRVIRRRGVGDPAFCGTSGRVSHLILNDGWASFSDYADSAAYRAVTPLIEIDWQLYTETIGQVLWAFDNPEFGRALGALIRACSGPEAHRASWKAWEEYDVTSLLPLIAAPTLVVHNKNSRLYLHGRLGFGAADRGLRFRP